MLKASPTHLDSFLQNLEGETARSLSNSLSTWVLFGKLKREGGGGGEEIYSDSTHLESTVTL